LQRKESGMLLASADAKTEKLLHLYQLKKKQKNEKTQRY